MRATSWGPTRLVRASPAETVGKRRAPAHAPRLPFAVLVAGLIAGGLALLLLLNTASAANEVRRHDLTARDATVAAQVQQLRNEVAASAAPQNLAQAAAALGMVPAMNPAFLVVARDGTVRVLGSPGRVSGAVVAAPHHPAPRKTTAKSSAESSSSPASPTPTPTPTLTLPGGNR